MPELSTLSEAFPGYPDDHPQTLQELVDADPDTIHHPTAWFLRKQAVEVRRSTEKHYINGPKDAFRMLRNNYVLHPWTGKWSSYGLSENRQVIMVPHPNGGTTSLRARTAIIPKPDDLPRLPRSRGQHTRQPAWLILHGGTPDVLSKPGVARGLATLNRRCPIADVLFYHCDKEGGIPPTLWSVRAGLGMRETGSPEGVTLAFPDVDALNEIRKEMTA